MTNENTILPHPNFLTPQHIFTFFVFCNKIFYLVKRENNFQNIDLTVFLIKNSTNKLHLSFFDNLTLNFSLKLITRIINNLAKKIMYFFYIIKLIFTKRQNTFSFSTRNLFPTIYFFIFYF